MLSVREQYERCHTVRQLCDNVGSEIKKTDQVDNALRLAYSFLESFRDVMSSSTKSRHEAFIDEYQLYLHQRPYVPTNAVATARFALIGLETELKAKARS